MNPESARPSAPGWFAWSIAKVESDRPREDVVLFNTEARAMVAADGVTRPTQNGHYPNQSPARQAAELVAESVARLDPNSEPESLLADANRKIALLNEGLGLSEHAGEKEIAGAVAALVKFQSERQVRWAYIGDCGVAILDSSGRLILETTDEVEKAREHFPSKASNAAARRELIHATLRNNPARPGGYGVLTGEDAALEFIRSGSHRLERSGLIVAFTDGFRPFLNQAPVRRLIPKAVSSATAEHEFDALCLGLRKRNPERFEDEASVVAWRPMAVVS